ncbi:hypothetical protein N2152v2_010256 [Parachlorella kessleri]
MVLRLAASSASGPQLESYLTDFFGQQEPTQELLSRHPELPDKVTAEQAQQSVDAMLAVPLSVRTLRPLVRSCPRLLWRGQDFADAVKGDDDAADTQVKAAGSVSPMLAQELQLGGTTEPDYPGYWAMDYNPVHSSVTGMPCRWVGGPQPPLDAYVGRLLHLTTLAHSLPAGEGEGEWSDDE